MDSPLPFIPCGAKAWGMAPNRSPHYPLFCRRWFADKRDHYPRAVVFGLSGVSLCARQSSVREEDCSQKTITRSLQEYSTDPQTQECQGRVSGHYKPASNGRNDPAAKICVSRHFSSKQARTNSFVWGLFERKMPLFS